MNERVSEINVIKNNSVVYNLLPSHILKSIEELYELPDPDERPTHGGGRPFLCLVKESPLSFESCHEYGSARKSGDILLPSIRGGCLGGRSDMVMYLGCVRSVVESPGVMALLTADVP